MPSKKGLGFRVFVFDTDGRIRRLPVRIYDELRPGGDGRLPEYAGKRVRCAWVALELRDRRPVRVLHSDFFYREFDAEGRVCEEAWHRMSKDTMAMVSPALEHDQLCARAKRHPGVLDGRSRFAQRRYRRLHNWQPTDDEVEMMRRAIFDERGEDEPPDDAS